MGKGDEKVLVVSRGDVEAAAKFQGYLADPDGSLLARILAAPSACFRPRSEVEEDPSWKQLIPYAAVVCPSPRTGRRTVYSYARGGSGGEARLHGRRSIGVGGHVSSGDAGGRLPADAFYAAAVRELREEVDLRSNYEFATLGLINDDSDPVGSVHLGVALACIVDEPSAVSREDSQADGRFVLLDSLRGDEEGYESWSRLLIAAWASGDC